MIRRGRFLDEEDVPVVRQAVNLAQRYRKANGLPELRSLARIAAELSVAGHADSPEEPLGDADFMTTSEAAELLGCSRRTAARLAPKLGGRRTSSGPWLLDRLAVIEHIEGRTNRG